MQTGQDCHLHSWCFKTISMLRNLLLNWIYLEACLLKIEETHWVQISIWRAYRPLFDEKYCWSDTIPKPFLYQWVWQSIYHILKLFQKDPTFLVSKSMDLQYFSPKSEATCMLKELIWTSFEYSTFIMHIVLVNTKIVLSSSTICKVINLKFNRFPTLEHFSHNCIELFFPYY